MSSELIDGVESAAMSDALAALFLTNSLRRLYRTASSEGRLDPGIARETGLPTGSVRCVTCGMLSWDDVSAADCCVNEGTRSELVWTSPPVGTAARIDDARLLVSAFDGKWRERGLSCRHHLSVQLNFYPGLWTKALAGDVVWLSMGTWLRLLSLFGGTVPGCVEFDGEDERGALCESRRRR